MAWTRSQQRPSNRSVAVAPSVAVDSAPVSLIVAYRVGDRAVLLYGFAKKDLDTIRPDQLQSFRAIGENWLAAETITQSIDAGDLREIEHDDDKA